MSVVQTMLREGSERPLTRLMVMFPTLRCLRRVDQHGTRYLFKAEYGGVCGETEEFTDLPPDLVDVLIEMTAKLIESVHGHGGTPLR